MADGGTSTPTGPVGGAGRGPTGGWTPTAPTGGRSGEGPARAHAPAGAHPTGGPDDPRPPGLRHGPRAFAALASLLLVAATAAVAVASAALDDDAPAAVPAGAGVVEVGTEPGASLLGCAGGPVPLAVPEGTDEDFAVVQSPTDRRLEVVAVGAEGPLRLAGPALAGSATTTGADEVAAAEVAPTDGVAVTGGASGSGGAATASVTGPAGEAAPSLSALSTALTADGDLRGLAASSCAAPSSDAWLVGGSTAEGDSTRVVLVNPGATSAEVSLEVLTPDGLQQPPAGEGLVVPPGQRSEVLLEGLVPGAETLAVHVSSDGGAVAPSLVVTRLAGLVPRGVEVVTPAAAPATEQVVPGVATAGSSTAVLRLAAPGGEPATAQVDVLADAAGSAAAGALSTSVAVPGGQAVDVPLGGVPAGSAGVAVSAGQPVVAAVVVQRTEGADAAGPADLAVAPATEVLAPGAGLALPAGDAGLAAQVLLTNAGDAEATASVVGVAADGGRSPARPVVVAPRSTTTLDPAQLGEGLVGLVVEGVEAATPEGADGDADAEEGSAGPALHAALVLSASAPAGALAVVPPSSVPASAGSTPVLVAPPGRWP
ncbi:DUF5719 family protein [Pseudokineococcus basanitobsidens]|uniref:DUF5719 family protein n=1 Tax=Pseudokineococcus basanitobsidens TaxID=1926649 RepID=A0ABU8RND1_9ACTN